VLGRTISQLRYQNVTYEWLVFDEVYQGEEPVSAHEAKLATQIGLDVSGEAGNLDKLNKKGKQNSYQIEKCIPNYAAMMEILREISIDRSLSGHA